jgi:hypothetical protein
MSISPCKLSHWHGCQGTATHEPCCSRHGASLCCSCYRRSHFVEVRPCCSIDRARLDESAASPFVKEN